MVDLDGKVSILLVDDRPEKLLALEAVLEEAPQSLKLIRNTEAAGFDGRRLDQMTRTPKILARQFGLRGSMRSRMAASPSVPGRSRALSAMPTARRRPTISGVSAGRSSC